MILFMRLQETYTPPDKEGPSVTGVIFYFERSVAEDIFLNIDKLGQA